MLSNIGYGHCLVPLALNHWLYYLIHAMSTQSVSLVLKTETSWYSQERTTVQSEYGA